MPAFAAVAVGAVHCVLVAVVVAAAVVAACFVRVQVAANVDPCRCSCCSSAVIGVIAAIALIALVAADESVFVVVFVFALLLLCTEGIITTPNMTS